MSMSGRRQCLWIQIIDLFDQNFRVHDDPVADDADFFLQNPDGIRWLMNCSPLTTMVWPALLPPWKANHHIGVGSQQIHDFSFSFIPPLGPNNCNICHLMLLHQKVKMEERRRNTAFPVQMQLNGFAPIAAKKVLNHAPASLFANSINDFDLMVEPGSCPS
jgi:hypothetical protein